MRRDAKAPTRPIRAAATCNEHKTVELTKVAKARFSDVSLAVVGADQSLLYGHVETNSDAAIPKMVRTSAAMAVHCARRALRTAWSN